MTTHEHLAHVNHQIDQIQEEIDKLKVRMDLWEHVKQAAFTEKDPARDRMVARLNDEYVATYRWEINPRNGWLTVQLQDGSIMPTKMGEWCPYSEAADFFCITNAQIVIDDPQKSIFGDDTKVTEEVGVTEEIEVDCLHEWWVYSTSISPPSIMVQCRHCRVLGNTEHYTSAEWQKAYHAPTEPFIWEGTVEKTTKRPVDLAEGIPN